MRWAERTSYLTFQLGNIIEAGQQHQLAVLAASEIRLFMFTALFGSKPFVETKSDAMVSNRANLNHLQRCELEMMI